MNSSRASSIYGTRSNGGCHGDVFTSPLVVRFMLDKAGYKESADLKDVHILEPSCGEGEFVVEIAKRLISSAKRYGFDAGEAFKQNVRAYDIDGVKIEKCRKRLISLGIIPSDANLQVCDFLSCKAEMTDIVVGNPPYIRYENIPRDMLNMCRSNFKTFYYRCDIYVPFFEKTLSLLNVKGVHCFICSNRWLKNEYGKKLRGLISDRYALKTIINLEAANAFMEEVLAYPSITVIENGKASQYFDYGESREVGKLETLSLSKRKMPHGSDWTAAFSNVQSSVSLLTIEQQGFKIGIGVATGADAVFVSRELPGKVEPDLILPSINARDLRGNRLHWQGEYLLNPYNADGTLVNLDEYPLAEKYLEEHRERLANRHVARKSPSKWYKTIDRITPDLLSKPKILLPDISGNSFVFVDDGTFYPLHNIYYITGRSSIQLRLLAAFLMSDFVRNQMTAVTNAMNGGFSRWQSQHLRKLRLPNLNEMPSADIQQLLAYYERGDIASINRKIRKYATEVA